MMVLLVRLLVIACLAGVLFGSAGRMDLPFVWAYIGLFAVFMVAFLLGVDPSLREERLSLRAEGKGRFLRLILFPLILAHLVIAGLDVGRFHWSDTIPFGLRIAGLIGFTASFGLVLWAMVVNRFFSPAVRIQQERGHHVISAGPYRYVRHPGYAGMILGVFWSALALGSWWAMLPIAIYALLIVRRTALEDQFLGRSLDGYPAYAGSVPYRLIPYLW